MKLLEDDRDPLAGMTAELARSGIPEPSSEERAKLRHWAHTVLGFVESKKLNTAAAVAHLHRSLELEPEFRMKSYGPSMLLARELCE